MTRKQISNLPGSRGEDMPAARLHPQAQPVDTFVRPFVEKNPNNGLLDLANALKDISPGITALANNMQASHVKRMEDMAAGRIQGLTFDEAQRLRKEGKLEEMDDPWYREALEQHYGTQMARHRRDDLEERADPLKGNVEQWAGTQIQGDQDTLKESPTALAAFNRGMDGAIHGLRKQSRSAIRKEAKLRAEQAVFDNFNEEVSNGIKEGATPQVIHQRLLSHYVSNAKVYGVGQLDQDTLLLKAAANLVRDNPDSHALVQELLTGSRGEGIPTLTQDVRHLDKADSILEASRKNLQERTKEVTFEQQMSFAFAVQDGSLDEEQLAQYREKNPGVVTGEKAISWRLQNRHNREQLQDKLAKEKEATTQAEAYGRQEAALDVDLLEAVRDAKVDLLNTYDYLDEKGNPKQLTPEKLKERGMALYDEHSERQAKANNETPEQKIARDIDVYARNNAVNDKWKRLLAGGASAATPSILTSDKIPPALTTGAFLYEQLYSRNPHLLQRHISGKSNADFYELYRVAKQQLGQGDNEALVSAVTAHQTPAAPAIKFDINKVVREAVGSLKVSSADYAAREISDMALLYSRLSGIGPEQSVALGTQRFNATHTTINGFPIKTSDRNIPADFGPLATRWIDERALKEGLDPGDLALIPVNEHATGEWMVINKATGSLPNGKQHRITVKELQAWQREKAITREKLRSQGKSERSPWMSEDTYRRTIKDNN